MAGSQAPRDLESDPSLWAQELLSREGGNEAAIPVGDPDGDLGKWRNFSATSGDPMGKAVWEPPRAEVVADGRNSL